MLRPRFRSYVRHSATTLQTASAPLPRSTRVTSRTSVPKYAFSAGLGGLARRYATDQHPHHLYTPYQHTPVEGKWKALWDKFGQPSVTAAPLAPGQDKYYSLVMFPYPSGNLHMGHARVYTISDTIARYQRMLGKRVLHPMGWDAFGLPAENAAFERGFKPHEWTKQNISHMKTQLLQLGCQFDWAHELATCDKEYYKWTQWLFLRLLKRGLAYQKESYVNWDPVDETVLANEQVDAEGKSWRSGAIVEKKLMRQWYFKLTEYTEALLADLDQLTGWPDKVRKMQQEWIGKSQGGLIKFKLNGASESLEVFTTRPDTLLGCSFIVVAPEHPIAKQITTANKIQDMEAFVRETLRLNFVARSDPDKAMAGFDTGATVKHPITGDDLPVYLANYVLYGYGTGCVMGVPAHDSRDHKFATQYSLPIRAILSDPSGGKPAELPYPGDASSVLIDSGKYTGMTSKAAFDTILNDGKALGWAAPKTTYNVHDWLVSRQRYWGTPIPIIHCKSCGPVPVPEKDLPVELPLDNVVFKGKGSPLASLPEWVNCKCPKCNGSATRETDTMDTFVDSAWYYLRYPDSSNDNEPFDEKKIKAWMPAEAYVGGIEHAILHLLYARFMNKFLHSEGLVPSSEPFTRLLTQGMVHGKTYRLPNSNRPVPHSNVDDTGAKPVHKQTGEELVTSWEKMSKSKYNGIDPERVVGEYGADTVRLFLLFKAPVDQIVDWDDNQIQGPLRFVRRVWAIVQHVALYAHWNKNQPQTPLEMTDSLKEDERKLKKAVAETVKEVTAELSAYSFNTAIARLMTLANTLSSVGKIAASTELLKNFDRNPVLELPVFRKGVETLLILLHPMAPHCSAEAWEMLHNPKYVATTVAPSGPVATPEFLLPSLPWPKYDARDLINQRVDVTVMIQGKKRGHVELDLADATSETKVMDLALSSPFGQKFLAGKKIQQIHFVPDRQIINIVL